MIGLPSARTCALLLLSLLPAAVGPTPAKAGGVPAWAHESSDIPVDPAVTWGRLDSGLRYAILPNGDTQSGVSLRLLVQAGSIDETDAQRGLARMIARMGFHATRHFPAQALEAYLQDLGVRTDREDNPVVSFDTTVFKLDVPPGEPGGLDKAFQLLRDLADGIDLSPEMVESQRRVTLARFPASDTVENRAIRDDWQFLMPGTLPPERFPIGTETAIRSASPAELTEFYKTWYRPERMAVVVVGPVRPETVTPLIAKSFGDLRAPEPAPREPDLGRIAGISGVTALLHSDAQDHRGRISLQTIAPCGLARDTVENRRRDVPRLLAYAMLNRRLQAIAGGDNGATPTMIAGAASFDLLNFARISSVDFWVDHAGRQWRTALTLAEQELRRALQYGFHPGELRRAVAVAGQELDEAVRNAPKRKSSALSDSLCIAISSNRVFGTPAATRDLLRPALERVSVDDCRAALQAVWSTPGRVLFVAGNLTLENPASEIIAAYRASQAAAVSEPPAPPAAPVWNYTEFGPPGRVVSRREDPDLGITEVKFQNGVRLNLKRTTFEPETVRVSARVGGGLLTLPKNKPGLQVFALAADHGTGLGRYSASDLRQIFLGRGVSLRFSVDEDAFVLSGRTTPRDLELELQWLSARIADPGFRPEATARAQTDLGTTYTQLGFKPEGLRVLEIDRVLAGGDPRFGLPEAATTLSYTVEDLRVWLAPELATAPIELSLVGDLDVADAIAITARTLGALPPRAEKPSYAAERRVAMPRTGSAETRFVKTASPRGLLYVIWPIDDDHSDAFARPLNLLSAVLTRRLQDRLGGSSSPIATSSISQVFPGLGYLQVQVAVDPAKGPQVLEAVHAIASELRTGGVGPDELDRARNTVLDLVARSAQSNDYWLAAIAAAQESPERLAWCRHPAADFAAVRPAEVSAVAARRLDRGRAISYLVLPEPL